MAKDKLPSISSLRRRAKAVGLDISSLGSKKKKILAMIDMAEMHALATEAKRARGALPPEEPPTPEPEAEPAPADTSPAVEAKPVSVAKPIPALPKIPPILGLLIRPSMIFDPNECARPDQAGLPSPLSGPLLDLWNMAGRRPQRIRRIDELTVAMAFEEGLGQWKGYFNKRVLVLVSFWTTHSLTAVSQSHHRDGQRRCC